MDKPIRKVAVIGTGVLGTQIAALTASFDYEVFVYDTNEQSFIKGIENIRSLSRAAKRKPTVTIEDWEKGIDRLQFCDRFEDVLADADLVIEAIPENLELKRKVHKQIDAIAPSHAIQATNSSSLPISKIESATRRPPRCLNLHFYIPAMGLNMVDVMGGSQTTAEVMAAGKSFVQSIGCVPLEVRKEILGFCFNRVWRVIKRETLYMWADGFVDFKDLDRAWMIFTGMPLGPFGLMDNVGLEVVYDIEMVYYNESEDPKDHPPEALKSMIERNELGVKTGKGFYTYPDPEYTKPEFINK
jgi:3-hydroxybutyryl-CoA dehydrogenase